MRPGLVRVEGAEPWVACPGGRKKWEKKMPLFPSGTRWRRPWTTRNRRGGEGVLKDPEEGKRSAEGEEGELNTHAS